MKRIKIKQLLRLEQPADRIVVSGWVRTRRNAKNFSFLELNDGSCLKNVQVIAEDALENYSEIMRISTGSALSVVGRLVESPGSGQRWEIQAARIEIISLAPESYPLQKKRHTDEYLRTVAHLRPRTNKYGAAFRIRSELAQAVHAFYRRKGFVYLHTPIITGSDCEGAGELFRVTTLNMEPGPPSEGRAEGTKDFFGREVGLTVSGQLEAELFALSLGDVYTFGPTFRAENSNTRRHAAEFWMVEPEMAFCDLQGNMDHAEELIRYLVRHVVEECPEDLELFSRFVDKGLKKRLESVLKAGFERISYRQAVEILTSSGRSFNYPVEFGCDLQTEHERHLAEQHFQRPVIVYDYPEAIKPFYMRLNADERTVAAMDVLVPGVGEIIGGSQREERLDILQSRMADRELSSADYWWYLDSRRFGSVPHSGFGLGFERLVMLVTGISNIRDVIPFPRTPGQIDF